ECVGRSQQQDAGGGNWRNGAKHVVPPRRRGDGGESLMISRPPTAFGCVLVIVTQSRFLSSELYTSPWGAAAGYKPPPCGQGATEKPQMGETFGLILRSAR